MSDATNKMEVTEVFFAARQWTVFIKCKPICTARYFYS